MGVTGYNELSYQISRSLLPRTNYIFVKPLGCAGRVEAEQRGGAERGQAGGGARADGEDPELPGGGGGPGQEEETAAQGGRATSPPSAERGGGWPGRDRRGDPAGGGGARFGAPTGRAGGGGSCGGDAQTWREAGRPARWLGGHRQNPLY